MEHAPRLSQQDRADFEHALGQALTRPQVREASAAAGLSAETLRTRARRAAAEILAAARSEYDAYERLRAAGAADVPPGSGQPGPETTTGWLGVLALIVPIVAGSAALVFLLLGYLLGASDPRHGLADSLRTAGWAAAIVAATSALVGACGLFVTASRRQAADVPTGEDAIRAARAEWRSALLERGLLPFLLTEAQSPSADRQAPSARFQPRYSSPDFTSPDFDTDQ